MKKTDNMKQCFVISPIGEEGSDIRKDADDVFDYIIRPAMEECDIKAFRSDHLDKPGKISEQMFQAIHKADLCIADLTNYNPNVFYELAVAQSANRPVIILIRKGQELPFDVVDLRSVSYDLQIRSYQEKTHIRRITNYIKEFEAMDWKVPDLFGAYRPAAINKELESFDTSVDFGNDKYWLKFLQDTNHSFDIMGIGLMTWRMNEGFENIALEKAANGCKIRILLMHQDHLSLSEVTTDLKIMKQSIPQNYDFFESLARKNTNIEVRQIKKGIPHLSLTISDQFAIMVQIMGAKKWGSGPLWKCRAQSVLYQTLKDEFGFYWSLNGEENSRNSITSD